MMFDNDCDTDDEEIQHCIGNGRMQLGLAILDNVY
jgi:hypothetical protein